jgi:hypothetical protein
MDSYINLIGDGIVYLDNTDDIYIPLSKRNKLALLTNKLHFPERNKQSAVWSFFKNIVHFSIVSDNSEYKTAKEINNSICELFEHATLTSHEYKYIFNTIFHILNQECVNNAKLYFGEITIRAFKNYCELLGVDFNCISKSYDYLTQNNKLSVISHMSATNEEPFIFGMRNKQNKDTNLRVVKLAELLNYSFSREWIVHIVRCNLTNEHQLNVSLWEIIQSLSLATIYYNN